MKATAGKTMTAKGARRGFMGLSLSLRGAQGMSPAGDRLVVRTRKTLFDGGLPRCECGGHFRHALGLLRGEVGGFLRVFGDVVEQRGRQRRRPLLLFLWRGRHRVRVQLVGPVEQAAWPSGRVIPKTGWAWRATRFCDRTTGAG